MTDWAFLAPKTSISQTREGGRREVEGGREEINEREEDAGGREEDIFEMNGEGGKRFCSIRLSKSDFRISTRNESRFDLRREEGEAGFIWKGWRKI